MLGHMLVKGRLTRERSGLAGKMAKTQHFCDWERRERISRQLPDT